MSTDEGDAEELEGRWLPLSSRRLNRNHLQLVAESLGLPTGMSLEELRQVIDGKLADTNRDPRNVQLVIQETAKTEMKILLVDESGVFQRSESVLQARADEGEELAGVRLELEEALQQNRDLRGQLQDGQAEDVMPELDFTAEKVNKTDGARGRVQLEEQIRELTERTQASQEEVQQLQEALQAEKDRSRQLWTKSCKQLAEQEALLADTEVEVSELKTELRRTQGTVDVRSARKQTETRATDYLGPVATRQRQVPTPEGHGDQVYDPECAVQPRRRRGKAPPVEPFSGENPEVRLDDWLPALQRAAEWNQWTEEELLLQLAGHLRGTGTAGVDLAGCRGAGDLGRRHSEPAKSTGVGK